MALTGTGTAKKANQARTKQLEEVQNAKDEATLATPIPGRAVAPDADTADPKELAKQDPRVGPQDLTMEERSEVEGYGVTAGIRHDQMQGVQSAAWINDLDEEEILEEQLQSPANTEVAADRELAATITGEKELPISPRTEAEQSRGSEALGARGGKGGATRGLVPTTEETGEAKAHKAGSQPASQSGPKPQAGPDQKAREASQNKK